jgi:hypothetical protein
MSTGAAPLRLLRITELEARDHWHLDIPGDEVYFHGDYTARGGFACSPTNQLIANFKKKMDRRGKPEWRYKLGAIAQAAQIFAQTMRRDALLAATLVPMPPSKAIGDPMYDDRMLQTLRALERAVGPGVRLDIRDMLHFPVSQVASHETSARPTPDQLYEAMAIRADQVGDPSTVRQVWLFDDVLTTGAHFKAACRRVREVYPEARVLGWFIARRVPEDPAAGFVPIVDI